jgi:hypothetical protein
MAGYFIFMPAVQVFKRVIPSGSSEYQDCVYES